MHYFMSILVLQSSWLGRDRLIPSLDLSFWCLTIVVCLFLAMTWVCLQFVIMVFSDHTDLLFLIFHLNCLQTLMNFQVVYAFFSELQR